jgi:hypothetical protein
MKNAHFTLAAILLAAILLAASTAQAETLLKTISREQQTFGAAIPVTLSMNPSVIGGGHQFTLADPDFEYIRSGPFLNPVDYTFTANLLGPVRLESGTAFDAIAQMVATTPVENAQFQFSLPNGFFSPFYGYFSLLGSSLHLTAIEAEMTSLSPFPIYQCPAGCADNFISQMNWNVSVVVRLYGAPEPSSLMLLMASCMWLPRRAFRR